MFRWLMILLCLPMCSIAQIDIGAGAEGGFPMLFNKDLGGYNHSSGSGGARLHFTYLPADATFVPTLSISVMPYLLPVTKLGTSDRVLNMKFTNVNAMLYGRVRKQMNNGREWYYGIGVGASYLNGRGVALSGSTDTDITVLTDSSDYINAITPQVAINAEYRIPMSPNGRLSLGIGGQLLYSYYFERQTTTRMDVVDKNYNHYKLNPKLVGHMLNPGFYVVVYYRFGGEDR